MVCVPKVVGVLSFGVLFYGCMLVLGLSHVAEAQSEAVNVGELKAGYFATRQGGQEPSEKHMNDRAEGESKGHTTIKGDVLRVEGTNCFVQGPESKEGRLRIDETTLRARNIGWVIGARPKMNNQNYALSILSDQAVLQK
jgi:hypothetical protein